MNAFKSSKNTKPGRSAGTVHQRSRGGISYMNGISPVSSGKLSPFCSNGPILSLKGLIHPKITIGQPKDKNETIQRQVEDEEEEVQTKLTDGSSQEEEDKLFQVSAGLQHKIQSVKGGGKPLPKSLKNFFEPRFGADFSRVRLHTDSQSAGLAKSVNARAFTTGNNIVFGASQYSPHSSMGKQLLAHELAHTIQQNHFRRIYPGNPQQTILPSYSILNGVLQKEEAAPPPGCPTGITFSTGNDLVIVPDCPNQVTCETVPKNLPNIKWSLEPGKASIDAKTTINKNGVITFGAKQKGGEIKVVAKKPAAGKAPSCHWNRFLRLSSFPTGISSTTAAPINSSQYYGGIFNHTFISNDGQVTSLQGVDVGEQFNGIPDPKKAQHDIAYPANPFGGTFTMKTATLTPDATNNWKLTDAGQLGGNADSVRISIKNINVGHFIQSASKPTPSGRLPADMTLIQSLYWYCKFKPEEKRWTQFIDVAVSRTLRKQGDNLEFVTTVNGVEKVDNYSGKPAVFNFNASPISTPKSEPKKDPRKVTITASTLPAGKKLNFSFSNNPIGCKITPHPANKHARILKVGTTSGKVVIKAAESTNTNYDEVTVTIT